MACLWLLSYSKILLSTCVAGLYFVSCGFRKSQGLRNCCPLKLLAHMYGLSGYKMLPCPRPQFGFVAAVSGDMNPLRTYRSIGG